MASASRKIYLTGSRPDIRVPAREITLAGGNPPLRLYDTSGPYTDPEAFLDVKLGLPALRLAWILGRGDVEELPGPSSQYRRDRDDLKRLAADPSVDLFARIPNGTGQTYLRELLLVADHNSYHVGQLILVRRGLGIWPAK